MENSEIIEAESSSTRRTDAVEAREHRKKVNKKLKIKKKRRSKPFTVILLLFLMILIVAVFGGGGALIGGYVAIIRSIPDLGLAGIQPRTYTTVIYSGENTEMTKLHGSENREYATLENIPRNMQDAIVAIEDSRFYEHNGVDMRGIARSVYSTVSGKQVQGGSTLTQQLIKNNITNVPYNTIKTKLREQYLALKYEKELESLLGSKKAAKDYIMELYLNTISLGSGYNGVQVAARGYFGKDAKDLDLAQCACLAAITNNPSQYNPRSNPEGNKNRQTTILNYMLNQGMITQDEYNTAINEDIYSNILSGVAVSEYADGTTDTADIHSYYEDALIEQIASDLQTKYNMSSQQAYNVIYNGGLSIYSNYDTRIQGIVDNVFNDDSNFPMPVYSIDAAYFVSTRDTETGEEQNLEYHEFVTSQAEGEQWVANKRAEIEAGLPASSGIIAENSSFAVQPQCSMAIIDYHTGQIKAVGGGRGQKLVNRGFDRATDSTRQPGSVFKPLAAYAPAIDLGYMDAATNLVDKAYSPADGYTPHNWWGEYYRGAVTPRTALKDSMNVVAVKTMVETGVDVCHNYLTNFGFTTLDEDYHASTALGGLTYGVNQIELCAAYGTIANGGQYLRPMFYQKVLDHSGNILLENNQEPVQVIKPSTAYTITDLLTSVVKDGTGTEARFLNSQMPIAGKTGTTTDSKDLTFAGFTPYYAATIWYGFDRYDDSKVANMEGFDEKVHLRIWRKIMEQVSSADPVKSFLAPEGMHKMKICRYTGMEAGPGCPYVEEYFVPNETLQTPCTYDHARITNIFADPPGTYPLYSDKTSTVQAPVVNNNTQNNNNYNNYSANNDQTTEQNTEAAENADGNTEEQNIDAPSAENPDAAVTDTGDGGYVDPGYTDQGYTDPGYVDPGYADPGYVDQGNTDPGYVDPGAQVIEEPIIPEQ